MNQTHCAYCKKKFTKGDGWKHTDKHHRSTALCTDCYQNPIAAKETATEPDDPDSWWNKHPTIYLDLKNDDRGILTIITKPNE